MIDSVITAVPDTIYSLSTLALGRGDRYGMVFSIWGVGPGTYRVILKPTSTLPTDIKLVLDSFSNIFIMTRPQCNYDTVNSFANIAEMVLLRRQFTLFNTYVDSIFSHNSQSLAGWALRYHVYEAQADTINAIAAMDSLLNILHNNLDPMVPDSADRNPVDNAWLQ